MYECVCVRSIFVRTCLFYGCVHVFLCACMHTCVYVCAFVLFFVLCACMSVCVYVFFMCMRK